MSASVCKRTPSRRCSVQDPIGASAITRPKPPVCGIPGVAAEPGVGASRAATRHHCRATRTEAAARRIDQAKAGFYPSVNLLGFAGLQSLGIDNLCQVGLRRRKHRTGDFTANLQHRAAAGPVARRPCGLRSRRSDLQRHIVGGAPGSGRRRDQPPSRWTGSSLRRGQQWRQRRKRIRCQPTL